MQESAEAAGELLPGDRGSRIADRGCRIADHDVGARVVDRGGQFVTSGRGDPWLVGHSRGDRFAHSDHGQWGRSEWDLVPRHELFDAGA